MAAPKLGLDETMEVFPGSWVQVMKSLTSVFCQQHSRQN